MISNRFGLTPFGGGSRPLFSDVTRVDTDDIIDIWALNPSDLRQYSTTKGGEYETDEAKLYPTETFRLLSEAGQPNLVWTGATFGDNLVANGDFSSGTTGWTITRGTLTVTDGVAKLETVTSNPLIYRADSLVTGKIYKASVDLVSNPDAATFSYGTLKTGGVREHFGLVTSLGAHYFYFYETGSTLHYGIQIDTTVVGRYVEFDNVAFEEVLTWNYPTKV